MQQLDHLAIIMDGNARWAKLNNTNQANGHRKGAEVIKSILPHLSEMRIKYLTLYAFSSENWQRPKMEISMLMDLLSSYLLDETQLLNEYGIKLKIIGNLTKLSSVLQKKIADCVERTQNNSKATLCVAFSYGGRSEIVDACRKIINSKITVITEDNFKNYLYDPEMPDVDLLIRTSNSYRISNFLLWQLAYAELYFLDKFWPDFTIDDMKTAILNYSNRKRTFGAR